MIPAREPLIFALDVPDKKTALGFINRLRDEVGLFKVGLELFVGEGPVFLKEMADELGPSRFFLDLKFHDIPTTVLGAGRGLLPGVALTTVHSDQGLRALKALGEALGGSKILAVTVLTSLGPDDLLALGYDPRYARDPTQLVLLRARLAREAGCHGVICSGREAGAVKAALGADFLVVCPGIRPAWAAVPGDDQKRLVTPYEAIRNGADYIVVGRPIRLAPDPAAAARRVVAEIEAALAER